MMRRSLAMAVLLLAASGSYGADRGSVVNVLRVHWRGTDGSGRVYEWSDLFFSGDVDGFVTLWRGPSGDMFVFRQSAVYSKRLTSLGATNLKTKEYIRGGYRLRYDG